MSLKLKNTLIITGTLLLGMLIGILICGRFTKMKLDNMKSFYTERGFKKQFIRFVQPTEEQLKQLEPIFKENLAKNRQLIRQFKKERQELYMEFKEEAAKILTPEQMKKLDQLEKRHLKMRNKRFHKFNKKPKQPHRN